ncbi:MAG: hypothetical protein ACOYEC_03990 [Christensenellales bacterium]|nr:hypothetical protein [Clostridiales bacterium]
MRKYYRNWITYDQAFGRNVCQPHKFCQKPFCRPHCRREDICRDMLCFMCKRFMDCHERKKGTF